jgi:hypothetical protein
VVSLDQRLTYLNKRSLVDIRPCPSINISRDDSTNPGLDPVVQETELDVAESTGQIIPSIVIVYLLVSVGKLVPVNVIGVPPSTRPNLGEIDSRFVVKAPWNSTEFKSVMMNSSTTLL